VLGGSAVSGLRLERTRLNADGDAVGTGETVDLDVAMVLRSVGYRGVPVSGLPFDEARGVIRNVGGRVLRAGAPSPGEYVAGWIKRGPTGLIGTNRKDAKETVAAMLEDASGRTPAPVRDADAVLGLLRERGVTPVTWQGWRGIDRAEIDLGRHEGRARIKIPDRSALLEAAAATADARDGARDRGLHPSLTGEG
jgi:ferredoxin--NADP+ reductase